jgi:hypothetical protein
MTTPRDSRVHTHITRSPRQWSGRPSHVLRLGLALAGVYLLAALLGACTPTGPAGGQGGTTSAIPHFTPQPFHTPDLSKTPGPIVGAGAIKPHLTGVPAFTTQDMADFAKGHLPGSSSGSGLTIARNEFLPSQDAGALLGISTDRPDGVLVGLLVAQGAFPLPGGVPDSLQTYQYAFEVFDSKTGNLLMEGGRNQPVPNQPPTPTPTQQPTQAPNPPKLSVTAASSSAFCLNTTYPTITVKNIGGGTLIWSGSGPSSPPVTLSPSSGSLAAGGSTVVHVSGSHPGPTVTITFTSNGGNATVTFTCS